MYKKFHKVNRKRIKLAFTLLLSFVMSLSSIVLLSAVDNEVSSFNEYAITDSTDAIYSSLYYEQIPSDTHSLEYYTVCYTDDLPPTLYSFEQTVIFYASEDGYIYDMSEYDAIRSGDGRPLNTAVTFGYDGISGSNFNFHIILTPIDHNVPISSATVTVRMGTSPSANPNLVAGTRVLNLPAWNVRHTISVPARTGHFSVTISHIHHTNGAFAPVSAVSRTFLVNRSGRLWQYDHVCSISGKSNRRPYTNWARGYVDTRNPNLRNVYEAYIRSRYNASNFVVGPNHQVHHIRPMSLGGTNATSNLIHLDTQFHSRVTGWFSGY